MLAAQSGRLLIINRLLSTSHRAGPCLPPIADIADRLHWPGRRHVGSSASNAMFDQRKMAGRQYSARAPHVRHRLSRCSWPSRVPGPSTTGSEPYQTPIWATSAGDMQFYPHAGR